MIVYVLELDQGKFYVGRTDDLDRRLDQHRSGKGSAWTKMYKMIGVLETYETGSRFYEDMITKEMMFKHGIDNVRGGSYPLVVSDNQYQFISREIHGANDQCFKCGGAHFARRCFKGDAPSATPSKKPTRPTYFKQLFINDRAKHMDVLFTQEEISAAYRERGVWRSRKTNRLAKVSTILYNRHIKSDDPAGRKEAFEKIYSQL